TTPSQGEHSGEPNQADEPTIDAGYKPAPAEKSYAIGDYFWVDANNNGVQDADEQPVPLVDDLGVRVILWELDADGNRTTDTPVAATNTDADGLYLFDKLAAGDYEVEFELPQGYFWTTPTVGDSDADSNATFTDENNTQQWATTGKITLGDASVTDD